jgi:transcriptional regulator with XRE-family HTH domain
MKYPGRGFSKKMKEAVKLIARGHTQKEVAEKLGMSPAWIYYVMQRPDALEEYTRIIKADILPIYAKALRVMSGQTGSNNEWIAQGAARDLLTRFEKRVMQDEEKQEIVIRLTGGEIELGEPKYDGGASEAEDVDEAPDS